MLWPDGTITQPPISSPYGRRAGGAYSFHYGADFIGFNLVKAVSSGRVTTAEWMNPAAGITVAVDYETGVTIVYMHLENVMVHRGDTIAEGSPIGLMGDTGNATGECVHVEVRINGVAVDPVPWISARLTESQPEGGGSVPFPTPHEEEDMDTRSIITDSTSGVKFELLRGVKRSIGKAEWDAMRAVEATGGPKLAVAIIPKATLAAIPGK